MPCGVARVKILVPRRVESSGEKTACAIAIHRRKATERYENPVHTLSSGFRSAG